MRKLLQINIDSKRIYGLDILRACAILFVVTSHGANLLPPNLAFAHQIIVFDGVSIFFVLSGFLIGGILIRQLERNFDVANLLKFWKRRWFRTLPNYFLILSIITGYFLWTKEGFHLNASIGKFFIFSQNLFSEHPNFFPEAWSLSVEEWFYIISPILLFSFIKILKLKAKNAIINTILMILLFSIFIRVYKYTNLEINTFNDWDNIFRKQVFTRLDSLMFGVLGAYIQHFYHHYWYKNKFAYFIIGLIILILNKVLWLSGYVAISSIYMCIISFSFTAFGTLLLFPYLSSIKKGSGSIYKIISYISLISYSMYLLNLTVVQIIVINDVISWNIISDFPRISILLKYSAFWILTILGSILLYKYFEVPMTRLREKNWGISSNLRKRN